ncbi:MAG TPA: hypothetical protein VKE94_21575, partial [Gemmataceae bacterium]|nr:hypothetical protein [Gemmataceae bacterium]
MGTRSWLWLLKWPIAALVLVSLLAGAYTINDWMQRERAAEALDIAPQRSSNSIVKLGAELADSHGIKDEPAQPTIWYPQVTVYGRVVPNPQATVEIRSPFAGTLHADPEHAWPALGRELKHGQVFGRIDIRSSPQDRLDIQAKLAEARVKEAGADSILKVRQEQLDRLVKLGVESLVRRDLDDAKVLVFEARTQVAAAKAAVELWQKALDVLERRGDQPASPWTEPLVAVADGEVTELAARPGATIEVGGLVARVVDFRRPLVRLELPPEAMAVGPPPSHVDLFAVRSAAEPLGS